MVIRNTFDDETLRTSLLARKLWSRTRDDLFRIGYASGSLTHQRDFMDVAPAVARILRERSDVRLVLFRNADCGTTLDVREFAALAESADSIEWRELVPVRALPNELARFDINLAPLEVDNVFCESKSELKYTEAALVGVPTIASPTGPYRHATHGGKTGLLASSGDEWYEALSRLLDDPALRAELGAAAFRDALARYGPLAAAMEVGSIFETFTSPSRAFASVAARSRLPPREIHLSPAQLVFEADHLDVADVTVAIPLHNYEQFVEEALESVRAQRLEVIDLVVIDDASTDSSLDRVHEWVVVNQDRFNRVALYTNSVNAGLGQTRNALFELSASRYVLPLDADNRLRPDCATRLLEEVASAGVAFAYGTIQEFGDACDVRSSVSFDPRRLARGNYIDAMALVAKEAWAAVGGYDSRRHGWEDFEFWCQLLERGLPGLHVPETLADYRVHSASMLHTLTMVDENYERVARQFEREFPWLGLAHPWDFERRF